MTERWNEFLHKMSIRLREAVVELQAKVNDLYRVEELEDYLEIPDSPIEHIQAALMPLLAQVDQIQDYAEAATGRMELNLEEVDVRALLDGVLTVAGRLVEDKPGLRLEEDIEKRLPSVLGDAERLSQALLHYIHNAVKFTDSGAVTVRVRREPNNLLFEVSDTGVGIPEEKQELIFEPFETVLEGDDPRAGLGIGLKIVEHIIDLHRGETWFESEEGRGSSFYFTIPF
jgi:signal transduction histidine kinase